MVSRTVVFILRLSLPGLNYGDFVGTVQIQRLGYESSNKYPYKNQQVEIHLSVCPWKSTSLKIPGNHCPEFSNIDQEGYLLWKESCGCHLRKCNRVATFVQIRTLPYPCVSLPCKKRIFTPKSSFVLHYFNSGKYTRVQYSQNCVSHHKYF